MSRDIVERLRAVLSVSEGRALVPVLPKDVREAADAIEELLTSMRFIKTIATVRGRNSRLRIAEEAAAQITKYIGE